MNATIDELRARLAAHDPAARGAIEAAVDARVKERGGHADWAALCEEAGLPSLAFREYQLALRDDPDDAVAAFRLAHYYREQGDLHRAAGILQRLHEREPARLDWLSGLVTVLRDDGAEPRAREVIRQAVARGLPADEADILLRDVGSGDFDAPAPDESAWTPADADCVRFQTLFAGREDVHARQWAKPGGEAGYSPVHEPLTPAVARHHLLGAYTVGVYPIRLDGTCNFFALDLDIDKGALERAAGDPAFARSIRDAVRSESRRLGGVLRDLGFAPLLEDSGFKGRHLWVFLEVPEAADVLHHLGRMMLAWQAPRLPRGLHLEFFPKQAGRSGKGLGNLIKLPLGIHRRTGRRALLLDDDGRAIENPLARLRTIHRATRETLYTAMERLKGVAGASLPPPAREDAATPPTPAGPPPPPPTPAFTDADFQADPRFRHVLQHCPVLAELKRTVDEHRRLSHEEQLVLVHSLGHIDGGPQAVNYLLGKCVDVGPEKFMKGQLKGNPVSCPSIRKKIGHVTRRVACNCPFDFAPDRYPTPVLHLLTLKETKPEAPAIDTIEQLARRYAALVTRRAEIEREFQELQKSLVEALRGIPDQCVSCPGGKYRLVTTEGVAELRWEPDPNDPPPTTS